MFRNRICALMVCLCGASLAGCAVRPSAAGRRGYEPGLDEVLSMAPEMLDGMHYRCVALELKADAYDRKAILEEIERDSRRTADLVRRVPRLVVVEPYRYGFYETVNELTRVTLARLEAVGSAARTGEIPRLRAGILGARDTFHRLKTHVVKAQLRPGSPGASYRMRRQAEY